MGVVGGVTSLGTIVGPLTVGYLERYHSSLPGLLDSPAVPFTILAASTVGATILSVVTWCYESNSEDDVALFEKPAFEPLQLGKLDTSLIGSEDDGGRDSAMVSAVAGAHSVC